MAGSDRAPHIAHLVMLDNDVPSSFKTAHREKANEAVQILKAALGLERVSELSFGESDLSVAFNRCALGVRSSVGRASGNPGLGH